MGSDSFQTRAERVRERLRERIQAGTYAPGARLTLRAVAGEMGTSVIPVRDALAQLEQEGLVEGAAGRGWRVSAFGPDGLRDLGVLREALECQVARLCATRCTEHEIEELMLAARQVDRERQSVASNALEERFHLRLAELAGSAAILDAITKTHILQLTFGPTDVAVSRGKLHERLVRAIVGGDPDAAEHVMRRHIRSNTKEGTTAVRKARTPTVKRKRSGNR